MCMWPYHINLMFDDHNGLCGDGDGGNGKKSTLIETETKNFLLEYTSIDYTNLTSNIN